MSNASLKEQLQAVASRISDTKVQPTAPKMGENQPTRAKVPTPAKQLAKPHRPKPIPKQKAPKPKWLEFAQYGVELLKVYFPNCFKSPNDLKPLKIGIKQDLIKYLSTIDNIVTEDKACMVKSLAYYVNTATYHKCVVDGATRVDLEGNPAGVVSAAEAKYSSERQQARLQAKQLVSPHLPHQVQEIKIEN